MREKQTALKSGSSPLALSSFPKLLDRLCVFAQRLTRDPPAPHRAVYQSAITREIKSMSNQRKTILWNHEYRLPFPVFFLFFMDIKKNCRLRQCSNRQKKRVLISFRNPPDTPSHKWGSVPKNSISVLYTDFRFFQGEFGK